MAFISRNSMAGPIILLTAVLLLPTQVSGESFNSKISQAMDHYQQQQYGEAASKFLSAEVDRPKNSALAYNLANSNYMNEKYEEALEAFTRAEASTTAPALKQKALYNIGNSLYRLGKNEAAALAYKKALEIDPSDMDAKFNLEFVREQIKKQEQKDNQKKNDKPSEDEKQNNTDGQGEKDPEDQSAQGDKNDKEDQQDPPPDQGQKGDKEDEAANPPPPNPGEQDSPSDGGDSQEPAQAQADSGELSEEEAERWLSSLTEDHKKFSKKQAQGNMKDLFNYKGKDW